MSEQLDLADIQGLIARGYGNLKAACYVLLEIRDPDGAKTWLRGLADTLTTGQDHPEDSSLNVAFTSGGLRKLDLAEDILAMFANEFLDGMATPHRGRQLGDLGTNAPEHWRWGGPNTRPIDALLMIAARDDARLAEVYAAQAASFTAHGLAEVDNLDTFDLGDVEHFGFRDGISQPIMEGLSKTGPPENTIRAGEFVLGYPNEYGLYTDRPLVKAPADPAGLLPPDPAGSGDHDLGRNGSYLVFRQLSQDVRGFWDYLDQATRDADGASNPAARTHLAAKMVGRWPSGAPLVLAPDADAPEQAMANDFTYHQPDPDGLKCPLGAHVRRTHPRDSLDPNPGSKASIAVDKRHRILRRGREYGKPLADGADDQERGLHFICLNGNIARQFEFVQHTWLNNPKFAGLYDDADPLVGLHSPSGGTFTMPGQPLRRRTRNLPQFVTVRGGAYFFLPGIRAVRYLASGAG